MNAYNNEGLSPFHILLINLLDLAAYESLPLKSRGKNAMTDENIKDNMAK